MPRIRTITAAGVLAGATVLGGAGLAGATDSTTQSEDPGIAQLQEQLTGEATTTELSTGETDAPSEPTLPEQASDRAATALAEAPASSEADTDTTDTAEETGEAAVAEQEASDPAHEGEHDNHGADVSATAQETAPGPAHGEEVSSVAKGHGETQRADRTETDEGDADLED